MEFGFISTAGDIESELALAKPEHFAAEHMERAHDVWEIGLYVPCFYRGLVVYLGILYKVVRQR